ncbi:MAG: ATP-binding protein [Methylovirgula sp.]|uniref:AAA family ATPase n=1 Tax=Methylovirgula sp. TaxID=1978224 RepID=UPI00307605F8
MIIEFRVKNFRSFRDEAVLNLVASTDVSNEELSVRATGNKAVPRLLRTAAIYGANAGGKSNLVRAMQLLRGIVNDSAKLQAGQTFNIQPFRLDPATDQLPIEYEITFLLGSTRYQFGFTLTPRKILSEWLIVYKTRQPTTWYERIFDEASQKYEYKFSTHLLGSKSLWSEATRDNALFLSTAVQLNSDQLLPVFEFLTEKLVVFENGIVPNPDYTISQIAKTTADRTREFLSAADIGIANIQLRTQEGFTAGMKFDLATGKIEAVPKELRDVTVPIFEHRGRSGGAVFDFSDESEGTRKLFALAGPLFDIIEQGKVLVVDELDRSLHALLVRQLIGIFQNPDLNQNGAQLIFTTHDTSLLEGDLLRRDQIWFAEKDENQSSQLHPLSDFSPRKSEAIERGYLSGRYGGVPTLRTPRLT